MEETQHVQSIREQFYYVCKTKSVVSICCNKLITSNVSINLVNMIYAIVPRNKVRFRSGNMPNSAKKGLGYLAFTTKSLI